VAAKLRQEQELLEQAFSDIEKEQVTWHYLNIL
jgi:hypothetical protein